MGCYAFIHLISSFLKGHFSPKNLPIIIIYHITLGYTGYLSLLLLLLFMISYY